MKTEDIAGRLKMEERIENIKVYPLEEWNEYHIKVCAFPFEYFFIQNLKLLTKKNKTKE